MGVDRAIDITAKQRKIVTDLLERHLPNTTAWVYGSRAKWASRPQSDLDLVVFATPEQNGRVSDLREALEESNLPFRVDLFVWDAVPEQFRKQIKSEHVVLVEREERNVSDEWPVKTVQQLVEEGIMERPMDGNHGEVHPKSSDFLRDGIPFIMASNVSGGRVDTKNCAFISEDQARSLRKGFSITGDVLISHKATMGRTALVGRLDVPFIMLTPQVTYYRVIDKGQLDPKYLKNYFDSPAFQQLFETWGQKGSTRSYLGITSQLDLPIVVPPPDVQKSIAHILGTLDDKIELNRRMNETLEAMARALFKSWFVDFDPVRAKMAGRDPGLPQDLADLFPDRLVDSDLGEIPEGWKVSEIGEEVDAVGGATPSTKEPAYWNEGEQHWATPKDLSKLLSPVLLETDRKITDTGMKKISSGLLPVGTVLLSSRAPIGYLAIAEVPTAINQGFIAMVCEKRLSNLYVLFWCYENLDYIKGISGGSTFAEISKKAFRPVPVAVPSEEVLTVYEDIVHPLYDRIVTNTKESMPLVSLRGTLLPKLISGKLRVKSAESFVEKIASP